MRDLFSECTYVSVTLRNVNLRSHASHALTHEDTGCANMPSPEKGGHDVTL